MKARVISLVLLILLFSAGFVFYEKNKGKYGKELHDLRSELNTIEENQVRIVELKKIRADYFKKVFIINRPGDINSSISDFTNALIRLDNRKLRFTEISIKSRTGAFDFEITGFFNRIRDLENMSDKLESSTGAFILSKLITGKNRNSFVLKGEVSAE
ncbi:MAG: hypothetical protein KAR14_00035 [Candidatus Aminicenantes bacterium]|nr:hypothetical protein [Candidatus Aminicenantes bacterium]